MTRSPLTSPAPPVSGGRLLGRGLQDPSPSTGEGGPKGRVKVLGCECAPAGSPTRACSHTLSPAPLPSRERGPHRRLAFTLVELPAASERERQAFTLVELLVVIGIIALLVAMLAPSLGRARALSRLVVCQNNLHQLGAAFEASAAGRLRASRDARPPSAYPPGPQWPATPRDTVDAPGIYRCPEAEVLTAWARMEDVKYIAPGGLVVALTSKTSDPGYWYKSRTGADEKGVYVEFMIQDDGNTAGMDWHGWVDTDGLFRIYETGLIWIIGTLPNTPDFAGAYPRETSCCRDGNRIFLGGKPAIPNDGYINLNRNQQHYLGNWDGKTNYGINALACLSPAPDTLVLMDCTRLVIYPDKPLETDPLLQESARHLGRLNVLKADKSVTTAAPLDLSPQLHPELWTGQ